MPDLKVLDSSGLEYLWSKINMQDYPNNETLIAVINAIDSEIENLKTEVDETKKSVSEGKTLVADALTAKNVETSSDATFQEIADNITNNLRSADKFYRVQCGAYSSLANAEALKEQLEADGYSCMIVYPTV